MPCVTTPNSDEILRTDNSSSWLGAEYRRNVHLVNITTAKCELSSKCTCCILRKKIQRTNSQQIFSFQRSAVLVLFVLLNICEVASAAPRSRYGTYCGPSLANALVKVCNKTSRVTHHMRSMFLRHFRPTQ